MSAGRFFSPLTLKVMAIGGITLLLLILLLRVQSLVDERSGMRQGASERVAVGWGGRQTIGSPILVVPFETEVRQDGRVVLVRHFFRTLAKDANIVASLRPELRRIGIYEVPVYVASVTLDGTFDAAALAQLQVEVAGRSVAWDDARLVLPIADVRGIRDVRSARFGGVELALEPDTYDTMKAVGAPVSIASLRSGPPVPFHLELELAGSESLHVLPLANRSAATLRSTWPHPNFSSGAFLPARRTVSDQGFDAQWQVLELNRGFAQSWVDSEVTPDELLQSAFGVDLYQPVDTYQRNTRATKYAVLFIAITFMSIFLWEHAAGLRLHAMQYLLVGLGLSVFYLLLLALSEHLTFGLAYLVAAVALVLLIGSYMAGALRRRSAGFVAGAALAVVYALLYLLVLSEEYALLLGALLVFVVLAVIMGVTRRMDWYALGARQESKPGA